MTVFSIFTLQKFTNFHAIRSWSFHNICNEIGWPRFLRHPVYVYVLCLTTVLYFYDCVQINDDDEPFTVQFPLFTLFRQH